MKQIHFGGYGMALEFQKQDYKKHVINEQGQCIKNLSCILTNNFNKYGGFICFLSENVD